MALRPLLLLALASAGASGVLIPANDPRIRVVGRTLASGSALLFDWSEPANRNATAVYRSLLALPEARVRELQRGVARAAATLTYHGEASRASTPGDDAFETLVRGLLVDQGRALPAGGLEPVTIRRAATPPPSRRHSGRASAGHRRARAIASDG